MLEEDLSHKKYRERVLEDMSNSPVVRELAGEYNRRCDEYDMSVCGPDGMPRNGEEFRSIQRNAHLVFKELTERLPMGISRNLLIDAIRELNSRGGY